MKQLVRFLIIVAFIAFAIPVFLLIVNKRALRQGRNEVVIRQPGARFLGAPQDVVFQAKKDVVFAILSQAAYQHRPANTKAKKKDNGGCLRADDILQNEGWWLWPDFEEFNTEFAQVHLRAEVWSNSSEKVVAVAFGGTEFRNIDDWRANLRWFMPVRHDEYSMVVNVFGPAFVKAYIKHKNGDMPFLSNAGLYATGHSLGAGLAEEFAYSLPINPEVPRVRKVFAFDPTPVTGFTSIRKAVRDANKQNLNIDRIYERGEILAILRSITNFFHIPPACHPRVRQVRYQLFYTVNVIHGHSIPELACKLYEVSNGEISLPGPNDEEACS